MTVSCPVAAVACLCAFSRTCSVISALPEQAAPSQESLTRTYRLDVIAKEEAISTRGDGGWVVVVVVPLLARVATVVVVAADVVVVPPMVVVVDDTVGVGPPPPPPLIAVVVVVLVGAVAVVLVVLLATVVPIVRVKTVAGRGTRGVLKAPSWTCTVKRKTPGVVGVPDRVPVARSRDSPGGKVPDWTDHPPAVPPVTPNTWS